MNHMTTRTITISEESYSRIVDELIEVKNAIESYLNDEGIVVELDGVVGAELDVELDDWIDEIEGLQEIRKAIQEIGG